MDKGLQHINLPNMYGTSLITSYLFIYTIFYKFLDKNKNIY